MATVVKMPKLHRAQREAHDVSKLKRFVVMVCGRRWGKTSYAILKTLEKALMGNLCWWVAPTLAQSRIAERILRRVLKKFDKKHYNEKKSEHLFEFSSGGSIYFKTADEPDNLRGEGLQFVVVDEADFIREEIWTDIIRPALADKRGSALICSTPRVENGWFHKLFIRGSNGTDSQYLSLAYPSWTNDTIDPQEFEEVRKDLPSLVFRREFGAEFVSGAGTRVQKSWIRRGIPAAFKALSLGCDLAISEKETADFSAFVITGIDITNKIWVVHAEQERLSFNGILTKIKNLAEQYELNGIFIETVQFQASVVQELVRTTSLPVRRMLADRSKLSRFQIAEVKYENMLMFHAQGVSSEFEDQLTSFPLDDHDDYVDALVYSIRGLMSLNIDDDGAADSALVDGHDASDIDVEQNFDEPHNFQRNYG